MTDKEKLEKVRAEIERRFEIYLIGEHTPFRNGKCEALRDIISFIDSLQEEPQVKKSAKTQHDNETCKENDDSLTQEPVSEDLEKFAYKSGYAAYPVDMAEEFGGVIRDNNRYQRSSYIKGLKVGANWQKEQMMKDAVSAKITEVYYPTDSCLEVEVTLPKNRFEDVDKILIIKGK